MTSGGGPEWFGVRENTVKRTFWWPGAEDGLAQMEAEKRSADEISSFREKFSFEAELRELSAEDGAKMLELQASSDGNETGMVMRTSIDVAAVSLAVVGWTLPRPVSRKAVGHSRSSSSPRWRGRSPRAASRSTNGRPAEAKRTLRRPSPSSCGQGRTERLAMQARELARSGKTSGPPYAAVSAYADFLRFKVLPFAGGTFQQPLWIMDELRVVHSVYTAERERIDEREGKRASRRNKRR